MKIDVYKLELAKARACMNQTELEAKGVGRTLLARIKKGENLTAKTVGKIAKALGVDVTEIIVTEE